MLPVDLGGISGDVKYKYDVKYSLLLVLLSGDQLVDPFFDGIDVLCCSCPCLTKYIH